jgi:plastocyanin
MVKIWFVFLFTAAIAAVTGQVPVVQAAPGGSASGQGANWPGEEMPLPLAVRTPQDLAIKALAERQYLIFNLLAGGKLAFDTGNFATAATKWEALLRLPGLDPDIDRNMRPLALDARARAGGQASAPLPPAAGAASTIGSGIGSPAGSAAGSTVGFGNGENASAPAAVRAAGASVSGTVSGGGTLGPGGTVLLMKRVGGPTPRPAPSHGKTISQRNKLFIPRVLAIPVGSKVNFRNEDDIFHNVFSLSRPNDFDTGLYRQGASYSQTFRKAGVVQILCNIHASMIAYVFVVDTPYYTQADAGGTFTIKNVPPGEYELETWHEASMKSSKQKVTVGADGVRGLAVKVSGDKAAPMFIPDKSGKPRQAHLGY